jgi:hypothetical protein
MYQLIDTATDSTYWDQSVTLEGIEYLFEFFWSDRETCYYLNIYDQDENPIALLIRLVIDWRILRRFSDPRLPPGILALSDTSGAGADIGARSDLGARVILFYVTSDDPDVAASTLPS